MRSTDHIEVNRAAYNKLVRVGGPWTKPATDEDYADARGILDPDEWLDWGEIQTVLCLAAGGGKQGPLFASLGCRVTVFDLSPGQLNVDRQVALERGYKLELIEGDMRDLSALSGRAFDLVYQPVSLDYSPGIRYVYEQVRQVLRPGGWYLSHQFNPVWFQMHAGDADKWNGHAYELIRPHKPNTAVTTHVTKHRVESRAFLHVLGDAIGGLCDIGFTIVGFRQDLSGDPTASPGSFEHISAYVPPVSRLCARLQEK